MLELYQFEACPHCAKVRRKLHELGLDWVCRDVPEDRSRRERVERISGQPLVPVLLDPEHGMIVTEADDICAYLEETYGARPASPPPKEAPPGS
jgi:glutathione S-transferase